MLSKVSKPKNRQELIKALQSSKAQSVTVFEGADLNSLPSKQDLIRQGASVVILR